MKVEVKVEVKVLDGEEEGKIHNFTTIAHTQPSYKEDYIVERLNLVWNYFRPYESIKAKEKGNEEILEYFKDINHAYNDCTKYDTLKRMLDELQSPILDEIRDEIVHLHDWAFSREEILRIIDKYKAESEG